MITFMTWKWGAKYGPEYVEKLAAGVARHYSKPHRFLCITDDAAGLSVKTLPIRDMNLTRVDDGCYCRLRSFDPEWQKEIGAETIVWLDLDLICVGNLVPLFDRPEPLILLAKSHFNPCPVNGSVVKVEYGAFADLWYDFNIAEAQRISRADGTWRGSDQTWLAAKAPTAKTWTYEDGVYAYLKPGWIGGDHLPRGARIVAFPGAKDPAQLEHLEWVQQNWRI